MSFDRLVLNDQEPANCFDVSVSRDAFGLDNIGVEASGAAAGTVDFRPDFADDAVLGDNGFLLIANETAQGTYGVTAIIPLDGTLENSAATFALIETARLGTGLDDNMAGAERF